MIVRIWLGISILLVIFSNSAIVAGQDWIDKSFDDFSAGSFEASGQNLFADKKGGIRAIRRFDLNQDGFIDLLFNNTHDDDVFVPATLTSIDNSGAFNNRFLEIDGSIETEIADLNKDGFEDIIFCPNQSGIQNNRRLITIVWGGKDGWSTARSNGVLPVNNVKSLTAADLNGDGWLDIATLNSNAWQPNQPPGNIIRIYFGGENGFLLNRFSDIGVENAIKIVSGDFYDNGINAAAVLAEDNSLTILRSDHNPAETNSKPEIVVSKIDLKLKKGKVVTLAKGDIDNDGKLDIAIGTDQNSIILLKNTGGGSFSEARVLEGVNASSITIADVDADNSADLVTSKFSMRKAAGGEMLGGGEIENDNVTVIWGQNGDFNKQNLTVLDAAYTAATAVTDLDGDGIQDIVCATHQGEKVYKTESAVFFGLGNRRFKKSTKGIPTEGATDVSVIPKTAFNNTTVVVSNSRTGTLNEAVPLSLYYGGKAGFNNLVEIPFTSGYQSSAADLNGDGFVDLVSVNSAHSQLKNDKTAGINIFWGSKKGFDFKNNRTVLSENLASTSNIADLNKDGYLDIIVGFFNPPDGTPTDLAIYYGSQTGYDKRNRVAIPSLGRSGSPNVADYNQDGWLDIAVVSYVTNWVRIFYGSENGFSEENQLKVSVPAPIDLETADLNNDGFADLIVPIYKDFVNNYHDAGVLILWGSNRDFKYWNSQRLPSLTVLGPTVADFDSDGYLDLFLPAYLGDNTRQSVPMYLYWGSKNGFSVNDTTEFIADSGADAVAADFDKDGKIDLAIAEHARNSGHRKAKSQVFYNDGNRFRNANKRVESLTAMGTHWMWNYDIGHILTRKYEQSFTSRVFELNAGSVNGQISYEAAFISGGRVTVQVKSSENRESLMNESWREVKNSKFSINRNERVLQYRLTLRSDNGDNFPTVKSVALRVAK